MDLARVIFIARTAQADVAQWVGEARQRTAELGLNGFASSDGNHVLLVIEGGASDVMIAMAEMGDDPRYGSLRVLSEGPANRLIFNGAMGYADARTFKSGPIELAALSGKEALLLLRHMSLETPLAAAA